MKPSFGWCKKIAFNDNGQRGGVQEHPSSGHTVLRWCDHDASPNFRWTYVVRRPDDSIVTAQGSTRDEARARAYAQTTLGGDA